jgi:general stress protein 26
MKRLTAQEHAKALVRSNGIDSALKIAHRSMVNSNSENELPKSTVFFPTHSKTSTQKAIRERKRTNGFWTQVLGLLNKGIKNVK